MLNVACTGWRPACGAQRSNSSAVLECEQADREEAAGVEFNARRFSDDGLANLGVGRGPSFKTGASKLVHPKTFPP
jgi:hypothetical protein